MIRYQLPDTADLIRLGEARADALTVYVSTEPGAASRDRAQTAVKSAVDDAARQMREAGRSQAQQDALRARWANVLADFRLWGSLSRTLVVFLSPDDDETYVLPNQLNSETHFGDYFDVSQLIRAVTTPQRAFALTVSPGGWNLWEASATTRATELELVDDHPVDAADATNRMTIRGRQHNRRLVGDEGTKLLLERYAKQVGDGVTAELRHHDAGGKVPLFVFGNDPVSGLVRNNLPGREVVAVMGAADDLTPTRIDEAIRSRIGELTNKALNEKAERILNGFTAGLAVGDFAQLGRAAVAGAVRTMLFDRNNNVRGLLDPATGEVSIDDAGTDLLSRIAVEVLRNGGEVVAVGPDDITAQGWNGTVLAGLRHSLAG